ncbi:protein FdhD homolog [Candidatus Vecturithrix granuli]|uniref:Protein FdhD n=1 Tax=Vecturithrix granuli TaxID=1499967 RepID=A0A081BWV6_VECG1|nr:protein FdhD homolog [Candidatus Vecturithrix granuli]
MKQSHQIIPIVQHWPIQVQRDGRYQMIENAVCQEIPLEICINAAPYAMLMRTPGLEKELALGFCFTNELIYSPDEVIDLACFTPDGAPYITRVMLTIPGLQGKFPVQEPLLKFSSGAVNSTAVLHEIFQKVAPVSSRTSFLLSILSDLPEQLYACQKLRAYCGATHGAALINEEGKAIFCAEDVGRHNALDKLIGHILLNHIDTRDKILMLSSRASFEMIQKAVRIAFPVVASVSAPTDLALQVAEKLNCTYISFLKKGDFYIYTHPWRFGL